MGSGPYSCPPLGDCECGTESPRVFTSILVHVPSALTHCGTAVLPRPFLRNAESGTTSGSAGAQGPIFLREVANSLYLESTLLPPSP